MQKNSPLSKILQEIEGSVIDRVNLKVWNGKGVKPSIYIMPKRIAYGIYSAIKIALSTEVEPTANLTSPLGDPSEVLWEGQPIFRTANSQQKDAAKKAIYNLLSDRKYTNMINQLIKEREEFESKLNDLTGKLREIKAKIESNIPLKGKCNICRKFSKRDAYKYGKGVQVLKRAFLRAVKRLKKS